VFSIGQQPLPGSSYWFGQLEDNEASSILVGANVEVTVWRDPSYQGISEKFTASDSSLTDNLVSDNTISSLKVRAKPSATPTATRTATPAASNTPLATTTLTPQSTATTCVPGPTATFGSTRPRYTPTPLPPGCN